MPSLFQMTEESRGPSRYTSIASRYILRAIKMSPRCSAVRVGVDACAHTLSERNSKKRDVRIRTETIAGLLTYLNTPKMRPKKPFFFSGGFSACSERPAGGFSPVTILGLSADCGGWFRL